MFPGNGRVYCDRHFRRLGGRLLRAVRGLPPVHVRVQSRSGHFSGQNQRPQGPGHKSGNSLSRFLHSETPQPEVLQRSPTMKNFNLFFKTFQFISIERYNNQNITTYVSLRKEHFLLFYLPTQTLSLKYKCY